MTAPSRDSTVAEAPSRESVPAAVSRPEEDESDMPSDLEEFILVDEADSDSSNDKTIQDDVPKVYDSLAAQVPKCILWCDGCSPVFRARPTCRFAGMQAIPSNKLLLETDAPYFLLGNAHVSTPAYLGEVVAFVAVHLNVRPPELMQATLDNARALYG